MVNGCRQGAGGEGLKDDSLVGRDVWREEGEGIGGDRGMVGMDRWMDGDVIWGRDEEKAKVNKANETQKKERKGGHGQSGTADGRSGGLDHAALRLCAVRRPGAGAVQAIAHPRCHHHH